MAKQQQQQMVEHFSHKHPLTLVLETEEEANSSSDHHYRSFLRCYGCTEKIIPGVTYYGCQDCPYFCLHQTCADMPITINHNYHDPECAGDLQLTKHLRRQNPKCGTCGEHWYRLAYACSECTYRVCFRCALNKDGEAKLPFHQHPLHRRIPRATDPPCSICGLSTRISTTTTTTDPPAVCYRCNYCEFIGHLHCTNVPLHVESPNHPHRLRLTRVFWSPTCQICKRVIERDKEWAYLCNQCSYCTHVHDYSDPITTGNQDFEHFSHEHGLLLVNEDAFDTSTTTSDEGHSIAKKCHGCRQNISWGPYYTCTSCQPYHLHKLCAEMPMEIQAPIHPGFTLEIYSNLGFLTQLDRKCGVCNVECNGFAYYSFSCNFAVDIMCALKDLEYRETDFHPQHPLFLSLTKASFSCHACDKDYQGISYQCYTCQFWIHEQCASLPILKDNSNHDHEHSLCLIYSIPEKFSGVDVYCQICAKYMKHHNWAYYCYRCRYFIHVYDCSNPHRDGNEVTSGATGTVINLPLRDEIMLEKNVINGAVVKHHRHPMILFADQFDLNAIDVTPSFTNLVRFSTIWPTYHVGGKDYSRPTFSFYNGNLIIQITSVDLPQFVKHEAHPHVLQRTFLNTFTWCNACEHSFFGCGFRCTECGFTIDTYCALLPGKIEHRYDKHMFPLTYSAIEGVEEYVCEICEDDVIPKWFYHCEHCDQSIHARCIWQAYIKFERFYRFRLHKCSLTLVPPSKELPKCIICNKKEAFGHGLAYLCTKHKFMIHLTCSSEDEVEVSLEPFEVEEGSQSDGDLSEEEVVALESNADLFPDEVEV